MDQEALRSLINDIAEDMPIQASKDKLIEAISQLATEVDHWSQRARAAERSLQTAREITKLLTLTVETDTIKLAPALNS